MQSAIKKISKVIFDFDNTLFDAMQLKFLFRDIAMVNGYSDEESRAIYRAARNDQEGIIAITLERYLEEIRRRVHAEGKRINEAQTRAVIEKISEKGRELLLPGASELIEFCRIKNLDYYLLSLGVRPWQLQKMGWVGLDKIFTDKNTVFTVKENGGKVEALRFLFGAGFIGAGAVLFNDRVDESGELLNEFKELLVFLRCDKRDKRSGDQKAVANLLKQFGDRVVAADNLPELLGFFKKYAS